MKITVYIDGRSKMELDSEDVEIAKLLLAEKPRIEVVKEFMANGFSLSKAGALIREAKGE